MSSEPLSASFHSFLTFMMRQSFSRLRRIFLLMAAIGLTTLLAACSSNECNDNKNSIPLAQFFSSLPTPQPVSIDSISIFGIGAPADSILVDSAASLSETVLPFRIDTTETTYVIKYLSQLLSQQNICDTLRFSYDIKPMFVSSACGAVYYFDNPKVTHTYNFIDSVAFPLGNITNKNLPNINIYFRINEAPANSPALPTYRLK